MRRVDLNCDMAEEGTYDELIMPFISSCNLACGFHSGKPQIIEKTILSAIRHKVSIGAHPSYNDKDNFGRKSIDVEDITLMAELKYQISALKGMVESWGARLSHVKAHGALYNDIVKNERLAVSFARAIKQIDPKLKVMTLAHSKTISCFEDMGLRCIYEGFADRSYERIDKLRSRDLEGSVIKDIPSVLAQVMDMVSGKLKLQNGQIKNIKLETICLHSDTQSALEMAKQIYKYLNQNGFHISSVE